MNADYVLDSSYRLPVDLHSWLSFRTPTISERNFTASPTSPMVPASGSSASITGTSTGRATTASPLHFSSRKGTVIRQHFTYDNSAANPLNPNQPPKHVTYGLNTTDEMGELWLQVLPASHDDYQALNRDYGRQALTQRLETLERRRVDNPNDATIQVEFGKTLIALGRGTEALGPLDRAIELDDAGAAEAYYLKGMNAVQEGATERARAAFDAAVLRNPRHFAALNALGMLALRQGANETAFQYFRRSVEAYPESAAAQANLGLALLKLGRAREAIAPLEIALAIEPDNPRRASMLAEARAAAGGRIAQPGGAAVGSAAVSLRLDVLVRRFRAPRSCDCAPPRLRTEGTSMSFW